MHLKNFKSMDKNILISIVNMKLRDEFNSFSELCAYFDIEVSELTESLKSCGYSYHLASNQFTTGL